MAVQWSSQGQSVGSSNYSSDSAKTQAATTASGKPIPAVVQQGAACSQGGVQGPNPEQSVKGASSSGDTAHTQAVATVIGESVPAIVQQGAMWSSRNGQGPCQ